MYKNTKSAGVWKFTLCLKHTPSFLVTLPLFYFRNQKTLHLDDERTTERTGLCPQNLFYTWLQATLLKAKP